MAGANLAELVDRAADRHPDMIAVITAETRLTWGELQAQVRGAAAGLVGRGLLPGDRVGLLLGNGVPFAVAYFAALRAGLVVVPLNTSFTARELGFQLVDSGLRLLLVSPELADRVQEMVDGCPALEQVVTAPGPEFDALLAAAPGAGADRGGEDLAVLIYTSGTSGRPKGAMLSHRALLANLDQVAELRPAVVQAGDVVLVVLPLFHIYGLNAALGLVTRAGATALLVDRFDPVETLAHVAEHQASVVIGAPPMYVAWSMMPDAVAALGSVRRAISGAAPLPPSVLGVLRDGAGMEVYEGYGLTETAPALTTTLMSGRPKPGSIGRPLPGVELVLLDEKGDPVEEGDPGEITVRGPQLFSGYWPDGRGGPDPHGWFATGDVAYADLDGDLYLVDRRRELILVSGFNVYPREVEDVLTAYPGVAEAAVIGIPHPYTGESVKAFVVAAPGSTLVPEEILDFATHSLARFKCPTSVEVVDQLPHSATGKVSKGRLREVLAHLRPGG